MGIGDLFKRSVFGRGRPDEASSTLDPAMVAELRRLDLYKSGLGAEAIRYVAVGDNLALGSIAACSKATPAYAAPYYKDFEAKSAAERAANLALIRGVIAPGGHVERFMAVRHAVGGVHLPHWPGQVTPQQIAVIGLIQALEGGLTAAQVNYAVPWDTVIPVERLLELFVAAGGDVGDLFGFLLNRDQSRHLTAGSWQVSEALADLARTHPAAFASAFLSVDPVRRAAGLTLAAHHGLLALPELTAALVALLTKPYGKTDRELAISALAHLEGDRLAELLDRTLAGADIDTRFGLVQAAGRNRSPALIAQLRERAPVEKAAKVKAAIQSVLEGAQASEAAATTDLPGYVTIEGGFVAIPPAKDMGETQAPPASEAERTAFMACVRLVVAQRADMLAKESKVDAKQAVRFKPPTPEETEAAFDLLTRGIPLRPVASMLLLFDLRARPEFRNWCEGVLDRLPLAVALRSLIGQGYEVVAKLIGQHYSGGGAGAWATDKLREWLEADRCGLRELEAVDRAMRESRMAAAELDARTPDPTRLLREEFASISYGERPATYQSPLKDLPEQAVWPWLAENLSVFDEALGLKPAPKPIPLGRVIAALELLPAVPQRYLPKLLELAVSEKRPLRRRIMALVRPASDLEQRVTALLDDARQQVRVNAATWLADIRAPGGEAALRKRLKKEKADPVRTALIEALQRLGADLTDLVGPASLIAEAEAAAAKGTPELPAWLVGAGLPHVRFRDGADAPAAVLRHWLALAIRLKEPGATGQFGIYLDQLDPADARTLSAWVLESWIAFDTMGATLEDANAYAVAHFAQDWRWVVGPQTPELREELIASLRQQKLGEMLNSGSDTKGVLALACRADPVWAANRVRWYLKKHGRRSSQAMALLDALAGIGAPAAMQVVIAASTRLKQKSTQAHAAEIAERYAEDRGWTFDELADRTTPTAGFDDDGVLDLPCGEDAKPYVARLDAKLAIQLFNPEGKPVKALPAGDDETSRQSQKALSTAKKELKQVVDLQATRLFEAMCAERSWPTADWRDAFHAHPVMRRLVERLVWQGLDADGGALGLFRPTQEGDFTDAADGPVDIDAFARLRLAHGTLVDAETCRDWIAHLKDYEVSPFLLQFDELRAPLLPDQAGSEAIVDRRGWVAESLTYRGVAEKRGYERVMSDGGGCLEYAKAFPAQGVTATIHHSGSHAVDENNRIALKELSFTGKRRSGPLTLQEVPPVIRAECWADYHAMAAKGRFDPDWEKVTAW